MLRCARGQGDQTDHRGVCAAPVPAERQRGAPPLLPVRFPIPSASQRSHADAPMLVLIALTWSLSHAHHPDTITSSSFSLAPPLPTSLFDSLTSDPCRAQWSGVRRRASVPRSAAAGLRGGAHGGWTWYYLNSAVLGSDRRLLFMR